MSNDSRLSPTAAIFKAAVQHSAEAAIEAYAEINQNFHLGMEISKAEKHRLIVESINPETEQEHRIIALIRRDLGLQ